MNIDNATLSIIKTIIQLAKDLSLSLVAEGVEEDIQASKLLTMGCDYAQGYLFYKPLTSNKLEGLLSGFLDK